MSRLLLLVVCLGIARGAGAFSCGDVTGSGAVDIGDALSIAQFDVGFRTCQSPGSFTHPELCDTTADNACDMMDALKVAQCDVGLIGCSFTCGTFSCATTTTAAPTTTTTTTTVTTTTSTTTTTQIANVTGFTATQSASSCMRVDMAWAAVSGAAQYRITRCAGSGCTPSVVLKTVAAVTSDSDTTAAGGTDYVYGIKAVNGANVSATQATDPATTIACPDTTPPSTPTGLTLTGNASTQVSFSWTASTDNVAVKEYHLRRASSGCTISSPIVKTVLSPAVSAADTTVSPGTGYSYCVSAADTSMNESAAASTAVSVSTPPTTTTTVTTTTTTTIVTTTTTTTLTTTTTTLGPPSTPANFVTCGVTATTVCLQWDASTGGTAPLHYNLTRNGAPIGQTSGLTITDTGLSPGITYAYTVQAVDSVGRTSGQAPRNGTTATTTTTATTSTTTTTSGGQDTTAPSVPGGLTATVVSCTQISLTWNASTDTGGSGLKGYKLYRLSLFDRLVNAPATTVAETGLAGGRQYRYALSAIDNAGNESPQGSSVFATTPACNPPLGAYRWDHMLGGSGSGAYANVFSTVVDGSNNVIVFGQFNGTIDVGGATLTPVGQNNIFVVKYNAAGVHQWSKAFGGASSVTPGSVGVDSSGNVVIGGFVNGAMTFGGATLTSSTAGQGFLAKYAAANGAHTWSKLVGAPGVTVITGLAVDGAGNVDVTGYFQNTADFGGGVITSGGFSDVFLAQFDGSGNHNWSKGFGDSDFQQGFGIAADSSGNVLSTGLLYGGINFGGGTLTSAGGKDFYVAKFSQSGTFTWAKAYGDAQDQTVKAIATDGSGNVIVGGGFLGTLDLGAGASVTNTKPGGEIFLGKLSPSGTGIWLKQFGTGDQHGDITYGVGTDASGNVLMTGALYEGVDLGAGPLTGNFDFDVFAAKYDSNGNHIWSQRFVGPFDDKGQAIAADASGNVVVGGQFVNAVNFGGGTRTNPGALTAGIVAQYGP